MINLSVAFPPVILLLSGLAFVVPVAIVKGSTKSSQIWRKGLVAIWASHIIISLATLSAIPPESLGTANFDHPMFMGPFLLATFPTVIFAPMVFFETHSLLFNVILIAGNSVLWSLIVASICYMIKFKMETKEAQRKEKFKEAKARISQSKIAKGEKRPYVAHKKWRDPHPSGSGKGYYNSG